MGEGKRHEMMETLFGAESDGSEGEDQNEDFQRGAAPAYSDDEAEGGGEVEAESEAEKEESEAKRAESDEAEREESDANHSSSEGNQSGHQRRYAASERRGGRQQGSASGSEQSHETGCLEDEDEEAEAAHFHKARGVEEEDDEVEQAREPSEEAYDDGRASGGVAEMRDVFGDSDEEEQELDDGGQHSPQAGAEASASGDEASVQRGIRPDDVVPDEERHEDAYDSENEHPAERRARERPVGTPLHIDIPFCPPPGHPDKMHVVRVSNIMGIESRPFNPKTYVEVEEQFVMDESGHKQRIRLEDNVARWRLAHNHDGRPKYESNARFVKWSDGSMQLLIGNEVLDISVQKAHQDQAHLFLRHGKGILQSQGRLLQKMKFMPSSLSSKSHRLLTALVDSRNRKIYKVKNVITNKDPEREKEETEKMQEKRIRSKEDLQRKQEKITRKYLPVRERVEPQLSPGYLEGALEEDDVDDYPQGQRAVDFKDQLEAEGRAERRIMNAKRHPAASRDSMDKRTKDRQTSLPPEESEPEASEYESEGQDEYEQENEIDEEEEQQEEVDEEVEEDNEDKERWDDEDEVIKKRKDREDDSDHEASPPRKFVQRRRVVVSDSDED